MVLIPAPLNKTAAQHRLLVALRKRLPQDQVVTYTSGYTSGFKPADFASAELFKRAKLILVPSGMLDK